MSKTISKKDLLMIAHLRDDARITLTNLSKKICMPISTCYERLKAFKRTGLIRPTILIDFSVLGGYSTRVMIAIKVNREIRDEVEGYLVRHQNVNTVLRVNNGYSFLVESIWKNLTDSEDFIEDLIEKYHIEEKKVFYVIGEIKRESFLSNPDIVDSVVGNGRE